MLASCSSPGFISKQSTVRRDFWNVGADEPDTMTRSVVILPSLQVTLLMLLENCLLQMRMATATAAPKTMQPLPSTLLPE